MERGTTEPQLVGEKMIYVRRTDQSALGEVCRFVFSGSDDKRKHGQCFALRKKSMCGDVRSVKHFYQALEYEEG